MDALGEFKDKILAFLHVDQDMGKEEIKALKEMSREEKIDNNLMLCNITVKEVDGDIYVLHVPDNYSKLRAGDKVEIHHEEEGEKINATVVDVMFDDITIQTDASLDSTVKYDMEAKSPELLQSLIGCLEGISTGKPGASFLRLLSGEEPFEIDDFLQLNPENIKGYFQTYNALNDEQKEAVSSMLRFPPIHVLQGPPGTGKTLVLAATAIAASRANREVVVIANTHHAVNNALMKIHSMDEKIPVFKIGEILKAEELDNTVLKFSKFSDYTDYAYENRRKKRMGHVIGMTIWGAISSLGLHQHSHFRPYMALVDEASLMPFTYASVLGKCASSVCLFGDSRQMPPIFRPELEENELSISILDYCANSVENIPTTVLHKTYRMDDEICSYVSKHFYEPYNIKLESVGYNKNKRMILDCSEEPDERMEQLFGKDAESIVTLNVSKEVFWKEKNNEEALFAAQVAAVAMNHGVDKDDIAVITPFRKQVNEIRSSFRYLRWSPEETPLVDTVERLQGQDVRLIILSFAVTDEAYYDKMETFLLNPNRINVMISRAKEKVIILKSNIIKWD